MTKHTSTRIARTFRPLAVLTALATLLAADAYAQRAPKKDASLSDGEVVALALAVNRGEIVTSEPVQGRVDQPRVGEFATHMITDHSRAVEELDALGIAPAENEMSRKLTTSAQATAERLSERPAGDLGRAYMQEQVELHEKALRTYDETLIPSATSDQLRSTLEKQRGVVASHLEEARGILGQLR